jgi:hypothetical protein
VSGTLTKVDVNLFCSGCTGTTPTLTLSIRNTAAGLPTGADLATASITGFNSGASAYYTATFGAPLSLTAGTMYAFVIRPTANPAPGTYALTRSATNVYAGGTRVAGATSGTVWSIPLTGGASTDTGFTTYMDSGYTAAGTFVSSTKDSNPLPGMTPIWSTLSFGSTVPASTSLRFQVAASNSATGPFTFVGPDETSATYFTTTGAALTQFYGLRYLQYKAYLDTAASASTPSLDDVAICYAVSDCSAPATISAPAQVCASSTGNTASAPAGATSYAWSISNGTITSGATSDTVTFTAGASGSVGLNLEIVEAGGCQKSGETSVTIIDVATPTITPGGPTTFCAGGNVTLTSSSATGNQWYLDGNPIGGQTGQQYIATASGDVTVVVTTTGCSSAPSAATTITVTPLPATPTITPGGPTTFCTGGSVTLTSSSASGNQWFLNGNPIGGETGQQYVATASGNYTVTVTSTGCTSLASSATTVTVSPIPATPTITPGGPTTFCTGGSVTLTSSSATGNQWSLDGNPIGGATGQQYVATAAGSYTVVVTQSGCSSSASAATVVTVNPAPATPTITPGGPTTFCAGGNVTLTSSSASGNQWLLNGNPIGGATGQQYVATAGGSYTVTVNASGCTSAASSATVVTVNPIPSTPVIGTSGPTTFCAGGSVTLTSSSATGNQWSLNANPIGGATGQQYVATAAGNYTVIVTQSGCSSAPSSATAVTVNPIPSTPTITPSGPTTFCAGGSVTLTSSSASGNQWRLNGNPIGGATSQQYVASVAGDYSVIVTTSGCSSAASAVTTVTINPNPNATITVGSSFVAGSTGHTASVANAGAGATYAWSITNGTITAGTGTASITFTAGAAGSMTLGVTVTTTATCAATGSASPTVTAAPPSVTVTSVIPPNGPFFGGKPVTVNGTGFNAGATVTFGGTAATNVVVVNSTQITAKTPAHAPGAVNVTVTNTNASTGTLNGGYTYRPLQFDPNNDSTIDPSDIFYLVNYLFLSGPAPAGAAGMPSGDANSDGSVDPADIFYTVAYLFTGGPHPESAPGAPVTATGAGSNLAGTISLGTPVLRDGRMFVPVIVSADAGSAIPQAVSLRLRFDGRATGATIHRAGTAATVQPTFEISRRAGDALSWLVAFDDRAPLTLGSNRSAVIAELELATVAGNLSISIDPTLTMLSTAGGTRSATAANGTLQLRGVTVDGNHPRNDDSKGTSAQ